MRIVVDINININISFLLLTKGELHSYYIMCYSEQYARLKKTFSVLGERQMSIIVLFSVQSAAGSTLSVQLWNMLDPPFSGLSVGRRSLCDWRPAVRTGMKWQRLAGASP